MPRIRLTEISVQKLKPTENRQIDYFDQGMPGLVLRISYGGTKSWRVLYYERRKAKTYGLGRYPVLNLKQARERARTFLENPQAALRKLTEETFKTVSEEFLKRHVDANGLRSQAEIRRCLSRYVYPQWEDRLIVELKRGDVTILLDSVEDKSGPRQADMVLAVISKLFNWYQARTDHFSSPVVRGMKRTQPADRKRRRTLTDAEIRALWKATASMGTFGAMTRFALLTAQRREKIRSIKWSDLHDHKWTIAAAPREKATAGSLKLPFEVFTIISDLPRIQGNEFVFAASIGTGPFNSFSQKKYELDDLMRANLAEIEPWTFHDLRRTARSLMSRAGVRPEIAERVLGHAISGVEGVYDRHSYESEKADALVRLSNLIQSIVSPAADNVVPMFDRG